jgi:lysophospholipase L1-like esterase
VNVSPIRVLAAICCTLLLAAGCTPVNGQPLAAGSSGQPQPAASSGSPRPVVSVRITMLGDSITEGWLSTIGGGYQKPLREALASAGYNATISNQGRGGATTRDIADVCLALLAADRPQIVLLNAGTNDALVAPGTLNANYVRLLDLILASDPHLLLVVSTLIVSNDHPGRANAEIAFNRDLPRLIAGRQRVWLADMSTIHAAAMTVDGLHPNDAGYRAMAERWMLALRAPLAALS